MPQPAGVIFPLAFMNRNRHRFISIVAGIIVGVASTYPFPLGVLHSLIFWGLAGIIIGFFAGDKKSVVWSGILYGVFLSISFLFSRFGGTSDKIAGYSLLVAGLSAGGAIGGVVTAFLGAKIRKYFRSTSATD